MVAVKRLFTRVTEVSLVNATTIYVRNFEANGQAEALRAAAIVALKDHQKQVNYLLANIPVQNGLGKAGSSFKRRTEWN